MRSLGSGNVGASNVWRCLGPRYGLTVAVLDVAKAFAPTLAASLLAGPVAGALAGGAAMLGHWRPLFLGFRRGGKTVATAAGALFGLAPLVGLAAAAVWILVFLVTRYASVASIAGALALPLVAVLLGEPWPVLVFVSLAAAAVVLLHRPNIARLRAGTESRFAVRRAPTG